MPLYFVAALTNPAKILEVAKSEFPESDLHEVAQDKFFVNFAGTSTDLSQKLGIAEGATGNGIVLLVTSYHGRAPKSVWEWVNLKQNAK
ncbi:hypothetical protein [Paraburkholderia sp. RL17-381-BIF-C]|uniref:hypothetical protein n=1 Tax=Paraburkholderia sp. RL17-381-BIF-C TaxID=3031635 RepID=UPI0038BBE517